MPRIYLRLQVDFDDDDKVARLARYTKPGEARALRDLLVAMWRYCKREQSNGNVPFEIVGKLVYPDSPKAGIRDADRLVACDLATRTETGYYLPGFLKHNKSREQIAAEVAKKAEAGQKGGKASGQVRRGEADAKQSASPPRSHKTENREQRTEDRGSVDSSLGEERPVTLRSVDATIPPRDEDDERCTRHPGGNHLGEPCRGCQRVEERKQRRAERFAERSAAEEAERARDCALCEGTHFVLNADKMPTAKKCTDHRRTA